MTCHGGCAIGQNRRPEAIVTYTAQLAGAKDAPLLQVEFNEDSVVTGVNTPLPLADGTYDVRLVEFGAEVIGQFVVTDGVVGPAYTLGKPDEPFIAKIPDERLESIVRDGPRVLAAYDASRRLGRKDN